MEHVIVERCFEEPLKLREAEAVRKSNAWCVDLYGIRLLRSYLSSNGQRLICLFEAPDAESVRVAIRKGKWPAESVWTASIHESE
jgi:hypothetical protein